jgi:hypothetical protein
MWNIWYLLGYIILIILYIQQIRNILKSFLKKKSILIIILQFYQLSLLLFLIYQPMILQYIKTPHRILLTIIDTFITIFKYNLFTRINTIQFFLFTLWKVNQNRTKLLCILFIIFFPIFCFNYIYLITLQKILSFFLYK